MAGALRLPRGSASRAEESLVGQWQLRVIAAGRGIGGKRSDIDNVYVLGDALIRFVSCVCFRCVARSADRSVPVNGFHGCVAV